MSIEQIAYGAVIWFTFIAVLLMFMILFISKVEIKNSKRSLNLKLLMHYIHRFQQLKAIFDAQELFRVNLKEDEIASHFQQHGRFLNDKLYLMTEIIDQVCVQNRFVFIGTGKAKTDLVLHTKDLVFYYQNFRSLLKEFEDDVLNKEDVSAFEPLQQKYDKLVYLLDEILKLLNQEVMVDVLKK